MNYTELTAQIKDYLQEFGTSFVANIPTFIRNAENRILHEVELPVFTKNATADTSLNQRYLQLPTDYISPRELSITVTGTQSFLTQKDVSFIREAYPSPTVYGIPRYYAQFDQNTLLLGPTPDAVYPMELHYFYSPESIVTADTSWLGDNAGFTLLYGALVEGYMFNKGDNDMMMLYDKMFKEGLQRLKLLGAGKVRGDSFRTAMNKVAAV
jgi:hypothetical protein